MKSARAICALLAVSALVAAGCGGGSSSSSSSAAAPPSTSGASSGAGPTGATGPNATYKRQLSAAAGQWAVAAQTYSRTVDASRGNLKAEASATSDFAAASRRFANDLAALNPPASAANDQNQVVAALRSLSAHLDQLRAAAATGNAALARAASSKVGQDLAQIHTSAQALVKALG